MVTSGDRDQVAALARLSSWHRALTKAVMFNSVIKKASQLSNEDALTLTTAYHSHVFTFGVYTFRGRCQVMLLQIYGDRDRWTSLSSPSSQPLNL